MDVPEPIAILFMVLALIFSIGISLYVVIAMPRSIAQTGRKITHKSAQIIAPRITHKKHISKKREKKLIEQITWSVKTILVIIPIMALVIPPADMIGLSHKIVISVGLFCAATTTIWFSLEFAIAKLARLDSLRVW